jgi:hypothetical protein
LKTGQKSQKDALQEKRAFDFPDPPGSIPEWAENEAHPWRGKDNFELEVLAEQISGLRVEIRTVDLPFGVWGIHIASGGRARLCVNCRLPGVWLRFAIFHEIYHLISHTEGEGFWKQTLQPMTKFENEADLFAWAVVGPEMESWD